MDCPQCKKPMVKMGAINSGNSKYAVWKCKVCEKEKMECIGLNQ